MGKITWAKKPNFRGYFLKSFLIQPIMTRQHGLHISDHHYLLPFQTFRVCSFLPTSMKFFNMKTRDKQTHSTLCFNLYSRGYLGDKMLLFSNTTSTFKAFVLQSRRIPGDYLLNSWLSTKDSFLQKEATKSRFKNLLKT